MTYKVWYKDVFKHRENAPDIEYENGDKFWYKKGKLHRIDGPAIEYADGYKEYWYEGNQIKASSDEEFFRYIKLKVFW